MKIRQGFVSNSSSSSFMIPKRYLTPEQVDKILRYREECEKVGMSNFVSWNGEPEYEQIPWHIEENDYCVIGITSMDNFVMYEFLKRIDVDLEKVEWE